MTNTAPAKADETTDLREARDVVTPQVLANAWAAWRSRHNGSIGPGPAFKEAIVAGVATIIAAHAAEIQALEAERDEARDACGQAADLIRKQQEWQTYGERLEREADAAMAAEIQLQQKKVVQYRKALRLLLPFVDRAAGEGLEWMEDGDSPSMDPVALCTAVAEVLGMELGDDAYSAILTQGEDEIRAARAALPEAITPKETSDVQN